MKEATATTVFALLALSFGILSAVLFSLTIEPKTCADFATHEDAQVAYTRGALQLDGDGDGIACEKLLLP